MLNRLKNESFSLTITSAGETIREKGIQGRLNGHKRNILRAFHLIRLDLKQQVFGLSLGHLWLLLEPALQAGTYYFLLTVVFGMAGSDSTFAFFLVAIIFWRSHAMLTCGAPLFLTTKGHQYIDQGFGLNVAFMEFSAQELFLFLVRFVVLLFFLVVSGYTPHMSWLAALFVGLCMFSFTLSLAVWLSIIGVFFRDISKLVGHVVWLWWYLSPGLYSFSRIPEWAQPIFAINPFTYLLPAAHSSLLDYEFTFEHFISNSAIAIFSLIAMAIGWRLLKRFGYVVAQFV